MSDNVWRNVDLASGKACACRRIRRPDIGLSRGREIVMPTYMRFTEKGLAVVKGDVTAKGHEKWIELATFQMALPQGHGSRDPDVASSMSEVVITKSPDSASMQLFNESVRLRPMTVEVDFVKPGETAPYITFTLQNATVSVFVMATHQSKESVSLSFSKVTYNKHDVGADVSRHLKTLTKGSRANPGIRRVR